MKLLIDQRILHISEGPEVDDVPVLAPSIVRASTSATRAATASTGLAGVVVAGTACAAAAAMLSA
jgi:hypothetical protein